MNVFKLLDMEELRSVGQVEPNSLVRGDCLEAMSYINNGTVDLVLVDPPYG